MWSRLMCPCIRSVNRGEGSVGCADHSPIRIIHNHMRAAVVFAHPVRGLLPSSPERKKTNVDIATKQMSLLTDKFSNYIIHSSTSTHKLLKR